MSRLGKLLYVAMLVCAIASVVSGGGQVPAAPPVNPDEAAVIFYSWYLHELSANRDPMTDDAERLRIYVSMPLLREIKRRMSGPDGLDADYFIQAQDYLNEWIDHVRAVDTKINADKASTVVVLGEPKKEVNRLLVEMVRDGGTWKIRRVRRLQSSAVHAGRTR